MSEKNKELAETLRKLADVIESPPATSTPSEALKSDAIEQLEIRLEDILNLIQQLSLKVDGIITSLSGVQSQVLTLRSTIRSGQRNESSSTREETAVDKPFAKKPKEEPKKQEESPEPEAQSEESKDDAPPDVSPEEEVQESSLSPEEEETLKNNLSEIERQITDLKFQNESGFVDEDEFKQKLDDLNKQRDELLDKIG